MRGAVLYVLVSISSTQVRGWVQSRRYTSCHFRNAAPKEWVTEGLDLDRLDSSNVEFSGQGDAMPKGGLRIGRAHVLPAGLSLAEAESLCADSADVVPVRLGNSDNGWGTGCHPTTRLCLEFLSDALQSGETILDYGTGSGVLAIAALRMGASYAIAVDVDAEVLLTAQQNLALNDGLDERTEFLHVREVIPGCIVPGVDVAVANILIGQLVRPSMVAALCSNTRPGGLICLSGVRPDEVSSLRAAYAGWVEWDDSLYAEASPGAEGKDYWGRWARLDGRRFDSKSNAAMIDELSEQAVS
mmetsp:Transcript_45367/g.91525  ORF Transcript_45367/g.91525 Transcript_45367/m.91525 type:complete len:300 (+) Transcript_45367:49-948(+)